MDINDDGYGLLAGGVVKGRFCKRSCGPCMPVQKWGKWQLHQHSHQYGKTFSLFSTAP